MTANDLKQIYENAQRYRAEMKESPPIIYSELTPGRNKFTVIHDWEARIGGTAGGELQAFIRIFGDGTVIISDGADQKQTSLSGILEALREKREREGCDY